MISLGFFDAAVAYDYDGYIMPMTDEAMPAIDLIEMNSASV